MTFRLVTTYQRRKKHPENNQEVLGLLSSIKLCRPLLPTMTRPGADPGFLKGGGWYLGVAESMEHALKMLQFENWNLI